MPSETLSTDDPYFELEPVSVDVAYDECSAVIDAPAQRPSFDVRVKVKQDAYIPADIPSPYSVTINADV